MLEKLNKQVTSWALTNNPWTNVYGLARTIMALATAATLAVNEAEIIFKPALGVTEYPACTNTISIFCLIPNTYLWLNVLRWICVGILLVVASGWRPRYTAFFHWWISYSLQVSALTIDGGEQVAAVFTLLLLPLALTDPRKSHWERISFENEPINLYSRVTALVTFTVIRIQVAILYYNSTTAKLQEDEWLDGTAVFYYLQEPMLGLNPWLMKIFEPIIGSWLIVFPTWGTLVVQTILVIGLFAPKNKRKYILFLAIFMHEIFGLILGLISFSTIMFSILILYLRPFDYEFTFSFKKRGQLKEVPLKEVV